MPKAAWEFRWRRDSTAPFYEGQGVSFVATATDGSGRRAFIKTLRRPTSITARRRFRREAVAYETLDGLGPPHLIEHNAELWADGHTPLYMAIEYIEGITLPALIVQQWTVGADAALVCARELAEVLNRSHQNGVVHRDIKPANVVVREADITRPVFVDVMPPRAAQTAECSGEILRGRSAAVWTSVAAPTTDQRRWFLG